MSSMESASSSPNHWSFSGGERDYRIQNHHYEMSGPRIERLPSHRRFMNSISWISSIESSFFPDDLNRSCQITRDVLCPLPQPHTHAPTKKKKKERKGETRRDETNYKRTFRSIHRSLLERLSPSSTRHAFFFLSSQGFLSTALEADYRPIYPTALPPWAPNCPSPLGALWNLVLGSIPRCYATASMI